MRIISNNWAKTVNPEIGNTVISCALSIAIVTRRSRNNAPKSVRHLSEMIMYAELTRNEVLEVPDKKLCTVTKLLNADQAALRRYGAEITSSAKNGTKNIVYYSTNGMTELEAHPYVKDGEAYLVPNPAKRITRVGATDRNVREAA